MAAFSVCPGAPFLPDGLASLAEAAESEGVRNVSTLIERWTDGTERYDETGESILVAESLGEVVGVGALSRCPDVPGAMRVRRFYVGVGWRRRGVARALATDLIATGMPHADLITCNAGASPAAPLFWQSMGFAPVDAEGITHIRYFPEAWR